MTTAMTTAVEVENDTVADFYKNHRKPRTIFRRSIDRYRVTSSDNKLAMNHALRSIGGELKRRSPAANAFSTDDDLVGAQECAQYQFPIFFFILSSFSILYISGWLRLSFETFVVKLCVRTAAYHKAFHYIRAVVRKVYIVSSVMN